MHTNSRSISKCFLLSMNSFNWSCLYLISFLKKYKHTYLASCHKVDKLGMLIYSEAQNIIIMFLVKSLRAYKEKYDSMSHVWWGKKNRKQYTSVSEKMNNLQYMGFSLSRALNQVLAVTSPVYWGTMHKNDLHFQGSMSESLEFPWIFKITVLSRLTTHTTQMGLPLCRFTCAPSFQNCHPPVLLILLSFNLNLTQPPTVIQQAQL